MSTSDSDYSLDWLASDEDDRHSPVKASPEPEAPSPSSTASVRRLNPNRRRRSDRTDDPGLTSVRPDPEHEHFWHKCVELRCYLRPLSAILRGLRSGRYSERLSSFQESVAMDRIQRIMGVIQNPALGGRFFSIILKMEEMLHSWFPHIEATPPQTDDCAAAKKQKQQQQSRGSASPPPPCSSTHLRRLHASPGGSLKAPRPPPPPACSQQVTQDDAVSSSTDWPRQRRRCRRLSRGPPPFSIRSPCLERLLRAKESIVAPRTAGEDGWFPWPPADHR